MICRHQAILEYFLSEGGTFAKTALAMREEAGLQDFADSGKGLLEKKWTSIVRLQKKVIMSISFSVAAIIMHIKYYRYWS
jgi:hypothetical protein